jgi:hypothetical protein
MTEDEEYEIERDKKVKENLKKISNFLIDFEKSFKLEMWGSGEGYNFTIEENDMDSDMQDHKYKQVISISDGGYLCFEKQEEEEKKETE